MTSGARSLLMLACGVAAAIPARAAVAAPGRVPPQHALLRYRVDLDAPPEARFAPALSDFLALHGTRAFTETYAAWKLWLTKDLPELFGTPGQFQATAEAWLGALGASHPSFVRELEGLHSALSADRSSGRGEPPADLPTLAVVTSLYPLLNIAGKNTTDTKPSACTSILARQAGGRVLHGRSLDYEPRGPMASGTVVVDFRREGRGKYRCLHPLVYPTAVQWFTCVRPGAFSLSVNARSQGAETEHNTSFQELLRRVRSPGNLLLGEVAARAMEAPSYEEALAVLASSPVVSSNYFILAGAHGQGSVVTRFGNASSADVWALGPSSAAGLSDGQPPWVRAQTNVDHWVPFASGAYATHRRQSAIDQLLELGQEALDKDQLLGIYLTTRARRGSENRTMPEDTGVVLRPSTIATLILDPAADTLAGGPDPRFWRIWKSDPAIEPPLLAPAQHMRAATDREVPVPRRRPLSELVV